MEAGIFNFVIQQGSTLNWQFKMEEEDGSPIDLTGYSIAMQARMAVDDAATVISSTGVGANLTITIAVDPTTGIFNIGMTALQTAVLDFNTAVYDIEFTIGAIVKKYIKGIITLIKEVTR